MQLQVAFRLPDNCSYVSSNTEANISRSWHCYSSFALSLFKAIIPLSNQHIYEYPVSQEGIYNVDKVNNDKLAQTANSLFPHSDQKESKQFLWNRLFITYKIIRIEIVYISSPILLKEIINLKNMTLSLS